MRRHFLFVAIVFLVTGFASAAEPSFKAGLATKVITPAEPLWMAGYGHRNKPAEGKLHDLYIKALALEDADGGRLVLVTSDVLGLPRSVSDAVATEVRRKTGLPRERLMLTSSHTHSGPVLFGANADMYDMPADERKKLAPYTEQLQTKLIDLVSAAIADLKPATLAIGEGKAHFAINRRQFTEKGVIIGRNPEGPVDYSVPVLRVNGADGKLRAVVFGYACHNTTLDGYQWSGDYAGYTQAFVEQKHPGAVAMFWSGCAGDANPDPRRKVELCEKHGKELADAVETVLKQDLARIAGKCTAKYELITAPLGELPSKEKLTADLLNKNYAVRTRATRLLKTLEAKGKLEDSYPYYPVQAWRLGDQVLWLALGGEVVVDYDLRLKKELKGENAVWVTAYANDVMAYIPSARVLKEGGYEADFSMVYYGFPTKWAPAIEDRIIAKARELAKK
jgi:hypothetical protein